MEMWLLVLNHSIASSSFTNCICFEKLTRSSRSDGKSYPRSTLPTCLCSLSTSQSFLDEPPMDGLQSILCFEMACVLGSVRGPTAAGWRDNSQLWAVSLWEFLRELQAAMNSLAFGREDSQRSLLLCPLALNLMKEASPEPKRVGRAHGGGPLGDRLSCVQIPLG